jgi:hypothetical protein
MGNLNDATAVVFCDSPVATLLSALESPDVGHPTALLQRWINSAEAILSAWRTNRSRVFLLDWQDALSQPDKLNQWVQNILPCADPLEASASAKKALPGLHVMAACLVRESPQAVRIWTEIQAACQPFGDNIGESEFASIADRIADTLQEISKFRVEHEKLRNALRVAEGYLEQKTREHASECGQLARALSVAEAGLESTREHSLRTHEMLLTEIQSAHMESERFFEEWKTLEAATDFHHLQIGATSRGAEKIAPPHSQLDFSFQSLELFGRRWNQMNARLVEHDGHAGLALFDSPCEKSRPLFHWSPSGQENGVDYMLFVPNDRHATERLVSAPASDLLLIRELTARILGHLSVHGESSGARWSTVARRLLQHIEEIPERLHYDSVGSRIAPASDGQPIEFTLTNISYRGAAAERLAWTWKPGPAGGEIVIPPSTAFHNLRINWPADGTPLALGLETADALAQTRAIWNRFLLRDRGFFNLLATAHSDFVFHLCEQHAHLKPRREELKTQATAFARNLCNLSNKVVGGPRKKKKFLPSLTIL